MRVPQPDHRYKRRYLLRTLALIVPPLLALLVLWRTREYADAVPWRVVGFFVVWMALWIVLDTLLLRRYRCPRCRQTIRGPTVIDRRPGEPLRYYCGTCDIEWDTGLRESSSH